MKRFDYDNDASVPLSSTFILFNLFLTSVDVCLCGLPDLWCCFFSLNSFFFLKNVLQLTTQKVFLPHRLLFFILVMTSVGLLFSFTCSKLVVLRSPQLKEPDYNSRLFISFIKSNEANSFIFCRFSKYL